MRASIGHNPVIFMPSHRSYADFLLMSYVCFHYNIMLPVIAAGMGRCKKSIGQIRIHIGALNALFVFGVSHFLLLEREIGTDKGRTLLEPQS
jgi:1-acyl-sn-glycerol-3-phosphate acyltransferase